MRKEIDNLIEFYDSEIQKIDSQIENDELTENQITRVLNEQYAYRGFIKKLKAIK